jgi:hypothetical protein
MAINTSAAIAIGHNKFNNSRVGIFYPTIFSGVAE